MGGDCINRHRPANCQKCGSKKACGKTRSCFGHLGEICLWIADSSYLLPSSVERSCSTHWNIKYRIKKAGFWFDDQNAVVVSTHEHAGLPQKRERLFLFATLKSFFDFLISTGRRRQPTSS